MQVQVVKHDEWQQWVVKAFKLVAISAICSVLVQCKDDDAIRTGKNDYYPLRDGSSWQMLHRVYGRTWDGGYDTIMFRIDGDTVINGLTYTRRFGGDYLVQLLRKEGGKYYARDVLDRGHFSDEFLFLDEDAPVNTTWLISSYLQYKVMAVNSIQTINGVAYPNVIEMQVGRLDENGKLNGSARVFYARAVGEIYGAFPYGLSGAYADIEKSLLKYTP